MPKGELSVQLCVALNQYLVSRAEFESGSETISGAAESNGPLKM